MDGKLNCSMNAENAAFTKIRHLETRVSQVEGELDNVEQQVASLDGDLQEALTNLQEEVSTENVDTTSLNANEAEIVNLTSTNIETANLTATSIEAESIDVDNLENVNVLHGQTVDVARTIADIGQFQETHTTTANNTTTNTSELNVNGETNLTGQVNIDGDMTFTKDTGLSKLQGEYLEIDAANVIIENKNRAEYALYVPGVDGDALFGGSVAVQDTLAAKNLIVTNETYLNDLELGEGTVLDNPTFENIEETQEISDRALDIDENGKLIRKFIAGGSAGTVANALIANKTEYTYDLLDKYKPVEGNYLYHIILSNTAEYTFNAASTGNAYLKNSNNQTYEFENSQLTGMIISYLSLVHNNIFYVIVPTMDVDSESIVSASLKKINLNTMNLEYSVDVSEHFAGSMDDLPSKLAWLPSICGNVLSDDKPVLPIVGTNEYIDLISGTVSTRDQNFTDNHNYYLSKTNTWYELTGSLATNTFWATNNKYTSIEDAALIDTLVLEGDNYIIDAPVFNIGENIVNWIDGGVTNELSLNNKGILYRDENDNKVFMSPGVLKFNGVNYATNIYNQYGYVVNEYLSETASQVEKVKIDRTQANFTDVPVTAETITINDKATIEDIETSTIDAEIIKTIDAEIGEMLFYEGEWYHKRMSTKTELLDFIKNNTEDKNFKILFEGSYLSFQDSDFPEVISSTEITGTYQVYKKTAYVDTSLSFIGESTLLYHAAGLLNKVQFYNFNTRINYKNTQNADCLHLNNCNFDIQNVEYVSSSEYVPNIECRNMNNVIVDTDELTSPLNINITNCTNVNISRIYTPNDPISMVDVRINNSDRCYVAVKGTTMTFKQQGAGGNIVLNTSADTWTQVQPTWN